jgi:serine/threonine protein phosphatase PrpC
MWHCLHTISFNYPVKPCKKEMIKYMEFILNLKYVLPCGKCRKNLEKNFSILPLKMENMASREKFSKYINTIFELVQGKLKEEHPRATTYCGSTACLAIHCVDKTDKKKFLWLMNVGDSRCVLAKKNGIGEQLTKDHKPNSPEERNRIEKLGGKISFDGVDWRVKDLSLSRAFGDLECTPYVTHLPQIYRYKISSGDKSKRNVYLSKKFIKKNSSDITIKLIDVINDYKNNELNCQKGILCMSIL